MNQTKPENRIELLSLEDKFDVASKILCMACLSADRSLIKLKDHKLEQCYLNIIDKTELQNVAFITPTVCWECEAVLKRLLLFTEQVETSYRTLHSALTIEDNLDVNKLVSNVSHPPRLSVHIVDEDKQIAIIDNEEETEDVTHNEILEPYVWINEEVQEEPYDISLDEKSDDEKDTEQSENANIPKKKSKKNTKCKKSIVNKSAQFKPFACKMCPKAFIKSDYLKEHIRTHTGEKPYECPVCQNRFVQRHTLTRHMRLHTGEKPFACSLCPKRFIEKNDMNKHMRSHTGEKPYACELCDRKFSYNNSFTIHMRTHTGEKPYECHLCHKKFIQCSNLKIHMKCHIDKNQ